MEDYNEIIATKKGISSFVIDGKSEQRIPPKNAIMLTNIIVSNTGKGAINIFAQTSKDYGLSKEEGEQIYVPIVTVGAGQTFNFSDTTGLLFWRGAEIVIKSEEGAEGTVLICYLRLIGEDLSLWAKEFAPIEEFRNDLDKKKLDRKNAFIDLLMEENTKYIPSQKHQGYWHKGL